MKKERLSGCVASSALSVVVNNAENGYYLDRNVLKSLQMRDDTMKYYEKMLAMGCFQLQDVTKLTLPDIRAYINRNISTNVKMVFANVRI